MHPESVTATAPATAPRPHRDGFVPFRDDLAAGYREAGYWRGTTLGLSLIHI